MDISKYKVVGNEYEVPLSLLKPQNKLNCDLFDIMPAEKINELEASLFVCGQDHPIIVNQNMEIVGGHNRYFSLKSIGAKTAIVKQIYFKTKEDELAFMMRDNNVKRQLTKKEQRECVERFVNKYKEITGKNITQVALSKTFGFSSATAHNYIQTSLIIEESKAKRKRKVSAIEKKLNLIHKRHANTYNELKRCPKEVIHQAVLIAEKQVRMLKKLEAESI